MKRTKIKRKDNKEELEEIIFNYDMDLYFDELEEITAKKADKIPLVTDEYEEEIEFFNYYISRK